MTRVAVLNAGTATLKVAVLAVRPDGLTQAYRAEHAWSDGDAGTAEAFVRGALERIDVGFDAIGHRVVHGGAALRGTVPIDAAVEDAVERLTALAPLHNARALACVRAARRSFPHTPAFAVFDTAFHARRSAASMCYALPRDLVEAFELRRYGFHGIAHAALVEGLAAALGTAAAQITAVTLQLGSGCSACAVESGRSIETSMGYTPLEGLVMASRSGDIDPAIVLQLARAGYEIDEIERQLTRRSGLLALSGSADMREILAAEARGDERAQLALAVFVRRIVMAVGAYFTLLEGRGALVFGGGIGTRSPEIRRRIVDGLRAWDLDLDPRLNAENASGRISRETGRGVYALDTDEESVIAREVARRTSAAPAADHAPDATGPSRGSA